MGRDGPHNLTVMNPMTPAQTLSRLRKSQNLTIEALAKSAGLTRQAVYALESGKRSPSLETARKIAKALGVSLAVFD